MIKWSLYTFLCSIILISFSTSVFSQNQQAAKLTKFLIVIEAEGDVVKLTCKKGCTWKELRLNSISSTPQSFDQNGLVGNVNQDIKANKALSSYRFSISKNEGVYSLEGKEGVAWKVLNFDCPKRKCKQAFNQGGMTTSIN